MMEAAAATVEGELAVAVTAVMAVGDWVGAVGATAAEKAAAATAVGGWVGALVATAAVATAAESAAAATAEAARRAGARPLRFAS